MGPGLLAGDQAGELGHYSGQSRSGDRYDGCCGMGRGGCDRHPVHLRRLPRCTCQGDPANWLIRHTCPGYPAKRRDLLTGSCGHPGPGDRPHVRRGQAVSGLHSAHIVRVVPGPTVTLARTLAFALDFAVALKITFVLALAFALALALVLRILIPVADGLRPLGRRLAALCIAGPPLTPGYRLPRVLILRGGLVPRHRSPVGELIPDRQGLGVLRAEDPLAGRQQGSELVPGGGRVSGAACPVREFLPRGQGIGVVPAANALTAGEKRGELVSGADRVPGAPGPVGQVEPGRQGIGGVRTEYALAEAEQRGELVPGVGRVPGIACEVGQVVAVDQGVRVLGTEDSLSNGQ